MNTATIISICGLIVGIVSLLLSRLVSRRVRVRVHLATYADLSGDSRVCYFINVTNVSLNREVEITHVWFDYQLMIPVIPKERPLPKRLKADETWETWIGISALSVLQGEGDVFNLARVRISTGRVFKSKQNKDVPTIGAIPGGEPPAPTGTIKV